VITVHAQRSRGVEKMYYYKDVFAWRCNIILHSYEIHN